MTCPICFRHCFLEEGQIGFCRARKNKAGIIAADNYGLVTSLALDPIEKKSLKEFYPGSLILSVGSYGCNLRCPFCQNYEISQANLKSRSTYISPDKLVKEALDLKSEGNIGIAFTYNEPMVGVEYVKDCAKLAKENNLKTVLVTNGCTSLFALKQILPYIDAMNIDLKGFSEDYFKYIGSDFEMTKAFIKASYEAKVHIELTTLIVPSHNDSPLDMDKECQWIASLNPKIPLHITRYFPMYHESVAMTPIETINKLTEIAKKHLTSVYQGNI
jgi:pyruvate formate lyase activating enzyme